MARPRHRVLDPSLRRKNPRANLRPVGRSAVDSPFNRHSFSVGEVREIEPLKTFHETELSAKRGVCCAAVEDRGVILPGWTTVHVRLTAGSHDAVHDAMESPPEMLQVADDLWLRRCFRQVMMHVQPAAGVYPCADILDDLQGFRKDSLDFIPKHGRGFDFKFRPTQSAIP